MSVIWPAACSEMPATPCLSLSPPVSPCLPLLSPEPFFPSCMFGCFGVSGSQNMNLSSRKLMERNELCPLKGLIVTVGELAGAWEWWWGGRRALGGGGQWGRGVISWSCSAAHLRVSFADLGRAGSLSKYLHANWCYLIHLSVMRFHKFKN